jgi:Ca-activated chloride channel family protein
MARTVKREGHRVSVLGVGTEQGAPIPESGGGFVKDASGNIVVPRLDTGLLESIARAGGGLYRTMTLQDHDIEAFLEAIDAVRELPQEQQHAMQANRWVEEGPWLFWLILPIAAFAFRRGYLFGWLVLFLPFPDPVHAWQWDDLWQNPDQRAYQAYQRGGYSEAADLFEDPEWKAASEYAAGRYQRAVETLDEVDSGDNAYNKGNALARSVRFGEALEQYDRALELDPDDQDALYNRKLVKRLLQQQQQQGPQRPDANPSSQQSSQQNQRSDSVDGQQPDTASDSSLGEMKDGSQDQSSAQRQAERDKKTGDAAREPFDEPDSMADGLAEATSEELAGNTEETPEPELQKADEQWLRRIPDDPAGLLRRKFRYQYKKRSRQPASAGDGW